MMEFLKNKKKAALNVSRTNTTTVNPIMPQTLTTNYSVKEKEQWKLITQK